MGYNIITVKERNTTTAVRQKGNDNIMATKKKKVDRYEIRHCDEVFEKCWDKDWAIHSAECHASFYRITIDVVDTTTGQVVATRQPRFETHW